MRAAMTLTLLLLAPLAAAEPNAPARMQMLIERIAAGQDRTGDAADELVDAVVGPLAAAVGSVDDRPFEQQRRIADVLSRCCAALRLRVARMDLPAEDRALFDRFADRYPEVAEGLFVDDADRRLVALRRVPLEPNSPAGVLLVLKMADWDFAVIEAAFEAADKLRDPVLVRNLTRQVRRWTRLLDSGALAPEEQAVYAIVLTELINQAVAIIGRSGQPQGVEAIAGLVDYFLDPRRRNDAVKLGDYAIALGALDDPRGEAALLKLLGSGVNYRQFPAPPTDGQEGGVIFQTVGDAALLALLRLYDQRPASVGMIASEHDADALGFRYPEDRQRALEAFRAWRAAHGDKPSAARPPLSLDLSESQEP